MVVSFFLLLVAHGPLRVGQDVSAPLLPQAQEQSYYQRFVPKPTGMNGYEEYLQAADITRRDDFQSYASWFNRRPDQEDPMPLPPGIERTDTPLAFRRKWCHNFGRCFDLIAQGNQKPVFDPREPIKPETLFPEFSSFKQLSRFVAIDAFVKCADGNTGEAIRSLITGFQFSDKIGCSILIGRLVGIAQDSILLRELDSHWPQFSLSDVQTLADFFASELKLPSQLAPCLEAERRFAIQTIRSTFASKKAPSDYYEDEATKQLNVALAQMSDADRQKNVEAATAEINKTISDFLTILNGPASALLHYEDVDVSASIEDSPARFVASMVLPAYSQAAISDLADRTRKQIAYLTAKACEYRWINGKLPDKIEDFTTKAERTDPTTSAIFQYNLVGKWFEIRRNTSDRLNDRLYPPKHPKDEKQPEP